MSSYLTAVPDALAAASTDLSGIGQVISEAAAAAAPSTTGILVAAGDEVSAAVAGLFGGYAEEFQRLTAQTALFHAEFERALSAAASAYAAAEAASAPPLAALLQQAASLGRPLFSGPNGATLGAVLNWAVDSAGLGGMVNFPSTVAVAGPDGVTGVRIGFSFLQIPVGPSSFLGLTIPQFSYPAPTLWYFPTQASGAVTAAGTVYLQHGFAAIGWFYQPLAIELASQTNSVVLTPTIPSVPLPFGVWLSSPQMQQGVGSLFLGNQAALNASAHWAGFQGTLPQDFVLTGHSAGGGLAAMAASSYLTNLGTGTNHLLGVVMFDGVASDAAAFGSAVANLQAAGIPLYVVAAPPQPWNLFGATTTQLAALYPGQFSGVEIVGGSHVDSMLGGHPLVDFAAQLVTRFSPPGATAAVYTLATGWINDFYTPGATPTTPVHGIYGPTGPYVSPGGQLIVLGQATGIVLP
ncbi:PE family protein [Mycobacterium alsense]|uniref:PE family protein n=1 Tax=Mycobacterium alsense TaxID=324058 RepID=A0AA41XP02_9MYCO|nr:PE family protein [Mycobacterium alsense]MCV7379004.1 PE family protein [Mycobacterium alsense]OQZ89300.1 PE family protein [Mycobacterium alsense]